MHLSRLSIFSRTFLMMICAVLVAAAIGFAVLFIRPPSRLSAVSLFELAAVLQPETSPFGNRPFGAQHPFPGEGGPPPGADFDRGGDADLEVATMPGPPSAPASFDEKGSERIAMHVADMFKVSSDQVRVFITEHDMPGAHGPMRLGLGGGSVVALKQADGRWRVATVPVESFPTVLQQQVFLLLALGILVLLPLAFLFARALAAPIRRFSEAAQRLGSDTSAPPVVREGPPEMRQAVDSFNAMQARINRLLQERTQMIAAIAHDLRTPLTRLTFRLDGLPSPLAEKVDADIQEMKAMISAALDFIRDRSLGVHRQRLDVRLLVESVVDDLADIGHDVTVQEGSAITIEGDPIALRRAVVNLVENGLKYGERVRLRLRSTGDGCILEIDDDGPGIPEAMQQQVFEPFFRLEASRNRDTGGIGLGLATVRAIVLDHGGTVTLRNRKDRGLRAVVSLPATAPPGS
ncbi:MULTISPECIES: ATP-binding protein [Luteibacter]|jgi:two-component system OmpR family sensor kinase|uniref:HAMP domain-containing sensor histidine kinase n=1 Tax=Luteibacter sp. dw_328 TaxID=2719796 RepID=UPI0007BF2AC5|nr:MULTISPECIES: ATP-binding protein [Luteibacter]